MRFALFPTIGLLVLTTSAVAGVGMGDLEVKSFKGEPLKAQIRIVASTPSDLVGAHAVFASRRTMEGYKPIRREWDYSENFHYQIVPAGEEYLLKIESSKPVRLDLLDVTLGLRYNGGVIYKDFSVTLKNPPAQSTSAEPRSTPLPPTPPNHPVIEHKPAVAPALPSVMPVAPPLSTSKGSGAAEKPLSAEAISQRSISSVEAEKPLPPPPLSPRRGIGSAQQHKRMVEKAVPEGSKLISLD